MRKFVVFNLLFVLIFAISSCLAQDALVKRDSLVVRMLKNEYRLAKNFFTATRKIFSREELSISDSQDLQNLGKQAAFLTVILGAGATIYNRESLYAWYQLISAKLSKSYASFYATIEETAKHDSAKTPDMQKKPAEINGSTPSDTDHKQKEEQQKQEQKQIEKQSTLIETSTPSNKELPSRTKIDALKKQFGGEQEQNLEQSTLSSTSSTGQKTKPKNKKNKGKKRQNKNNYINEPLQPQGQPLNRAQRRQLKKKETQKQALDDINKLELQTTSEIYFPSDFSTEKIKSTDKKSPIDEPKTSEESKAKFRQVMGKAKEKSLEKKQVKEEIQKELKGISSESASKESLHSTSKKEPLSGNKAEEEAKGQPVSAKKPVFSKEVSDEQKKEWEVQQQEILMKRKNRFNQKGAPAKSVPESSSEQLPQHAEQSVSAPLPPVPDATDQEPKEKKQWEITLEETFRQPQASQNDTSAMPKSSSDSNTSDDNDLSTGKTEAELTPEEKAAKQKAEEKAWKEQAATPLNPLQLQIARQRQEWGGTKFFGKVAEKADQQRQNSKEKKNPIELTEIQKSLVAIVRKKVEQKNSDPENDKIYEALSSQQKKLAMELYLAIEKQKSTEATNLKFDAIRNANKINRPGIPQFNKEENSDSESDEKDYEWED